MKKRLIAFLLVLIMVLGMLPVSAFAADDGVSPQALESNETQTIKYQILYVGDEFNIGYNYGASVNKTYTCQYSTGHSGFNHSILISEFRNVGVPALKGQLDSGYEFVGWAKEAKENPTIYDFNVAGTTATQTTYTIYLVAKKAVPPTVTYTLTYYPNTTDLVTNMPSPNPVTQKSSTSPVTFTVSSAIPAREGYNFLGWNGKPDATTPTVQPGNWVTTTATTTKLYAVWQSNTPPTDKPAKPTENDVTGVVVDIVCVTTTGTHDTVQYPLGHPTDAQHTIGEVVSDGAGGYICPVTVRTAWFVQQASNLVWKVQHTPTAQTITFNLTYDKNSKTWVKPAANPRIEATHEVTPPRKPALNEGSPVCVQCEKTNSIHVQNGKDYARMYFGVSDSTRYTEVLKDGKNVWKDDNGVWTYQIKLKKDKYIEAFNTTPLINSEHTDLYPDQDAYVTWKRDGNQWKIVPVSPNQSGIGAVINVTCKLKAPTADELKKLDMAVQVKCVVDAAQQHTSAYGLLGEYDKDYFVGEPKKVGDDWLCDISYDPDPYVAAFNKAFPTPKHIQNDEKIVPVTLIWVGGSWQIKTQGRVLVTEVYTVTFDSYGGTPVPPAQEVEYGLTATEPADPTLKGYTFAFWYLGEDEQNATAYDFDTPVTENITLTAKWNINKYTVAFNTDGGTPVPPAQEVEYGLTATEPADPTLKGYTFAFWYLGEDEQNATAYDFDTPVTENITLTAKWNINKYTVAFNTDGGTPVPPAQEVEYGLTATEPAAPEKTGYTFDGRYLGDEKYDFSAAVEQNITLTAKWHITPHNIYAYARLNSYFAPLTTSEFDKPVTLNAATLSRLGLGSYNSLGYISIGSFDFDAMPLTSDLYFGEDAELAAALAKLAQSIALETGVSDKIAEKIAWTALYKTVNEEDMEPGYPAEAGYQLSGNLNLASVTFRAGAENVGNMPAVNYTRDDGVIDFYDFYFAGDTITMPADPTREGYIFEGWSIKVLPDENDADHLDADGADDAADETLLKSGDTYTITAGGVIFTAQWEKKTFTVKYYLPDETGAWVEKKMDTVDSVDYATYSLWTPNAEDGYEFSGWYQKAADIGVKAKVEKLYMAKEWKLYGKFTPIEYTIQYVYNDGKATSTNPTTYTVESDTITLADATGADWGKTFLEWHDANGQKITEIPTGSTGDRVITAYWNWPVHLHYLDKDNNEIDSATLYVSELEPGACVLPTGEKTGYDFDGWYEAQKDIGTASHKLNALSIAKKWELYGRYTAKTDVSYTVKYLREGDNKVLAPEKVVTDQTFDTEVTEQAADVVGYTPDAPSKTMILDEYNKVLTFSYSANTYDYTVRHIKQLPDGSYDEANAEVETLSGKFEALAAVTAKDYGEHYPTNDADTKQNIKIEEGLTIDVKYDLDEHTLTFETNGGSAINPVTVRHGNAVARPADPTKDKYTFIGWYADPEFTEEYDFATVLEADKTIYAKFELTSTPIGDIYVRYDVLHIKQLPDGTYDLANAEVEHLSAKKDTTVTAVIKDYRATHHVNVNRTLSKLTGTAIQPYKGVDGKPVYTILSVYYDLDFHTLTFDTMGGSKIAPETVRHGLTVAKPKDPVNGGYIFDGWYTDKTYRTPYNFATPLTQDTTIYAKWFLIVLPGVTDKKATPKLNTSDHFAYVQGYPNGTVKPAGNITRAETAAILFRLMDDASRKTYYSTKSGFRDVASGSWYNTYVATLNNAGVITDSSNGYFRPNEAITRAELAAMLAKFSETTGAANYFNDVSAKYWAANAIAICAKLGWINGYPDGTFRPDKNVTRAELMAMINRATGRAPKSADAFLPGMKTWIDNTSDKWYYLDVQEATNSHSYTVKGSETWTALTSDPNWSLYE
ncbi:MAG: InlB B-repeat-containing protein [Oscillospiraceae bacterium]